MKKVLLAVFLSIPLISSAATTAQFNPEKEGLPLPDGGIKVVPMKKMAAFNTSHNKTHLKIHQNIHKKQCRKFNSHYNPKFRIFISTPTL